jgi:hypothetical protein
MYRIDSREITRRIYAANDVFKNDALLTMQIANRCHKKAMLKVYPNVPLTRIWLCVHRTWRWSRCNSGEQGLAWHARQSAHASPTRAKRFREATRSWAERDFSGVLRDMALFESWWPSRLTAF